MLGLRTLLVAAALVVGCTSAKDEPELKAEPEVDRPAATTDVDPRFVGKWKLDKYGVSCEIAIVDGKPVITAQDYANSEAFQVTKIRWEDPELKASFRMPSTNHITHSTFTIIDESSMRDVYEGAAAGDDRWTKQAGATAATGAGAPTSKTAPAAAAAPREGPGARAARGEVAPADDMPPPGAAAAPAKTPPAHKGATVTPPRAE